MEPLATYPCRPAVYVQEGGGKAVDWDRCEAAVLTDTVTGQVVRESTTVAACWSPEAIHVRFICEDSHVVSQYRHRDDPLYEQDVVELFIDENGTGREYIELEVSPHNVVFDARIQNDGNQSITASDTAWDFVGLETAVKLDAEGRRIYDITIPAANFANPPSAGGSWRVNFYRIDEDLDGLREYQAWSLTGEVNYHIPSRFGRLLFLNE